MVHDCVPSSGRLCLVLASCLSLACGKVTTPDGPNATERRDTVTTTQEASPRGMGGAMQGSGGADPDEGGETICDAVAVAGLNVGITSNDFECEELRVIATATNFEEELVCPVDDTCRCFGVSERPGTYRITVEIRDTGVELLQSRELNVGMDAANCHVRTQTLNLRVRAPEVEPDAGVADAGGEEVDPDPVDPDPVGPDAGG